MARFNDLNTQKSFKYLYDVETLAQDILTNKEFRLEISNARNKFREALRELEKSEDRTTWMKSGSVHVKRPTKECIKMVQTELQNSDRDINQFDENIKRKIHQLRDLEQEPRLEGFSLKPMSASEAKGLYKGFGLQV